MSSLGSYPSHVNKQRTSFRTTIPLPVARALAIAHKDKIIWEIKVDEKGLPFVIVKKLANIGPRKAAN